MAQTPSTMLLPLGARLPEFHLKDGQGAAVSSDSISEAPVALVMFICNHCPFVKHIREELARLGRDYAAKGVGVVAINSNDVEKYPDDAPPKMVEEARTAGYTFPYLFDPDQEVAKKFMASCTPDFFVFSRERGLIYRGQLDDSRPVKQGSPIPVTGRDLRAALDAALEGRSAPPEQRPSVGCNIKWKSGNEPGYITSIG